MLLSTAVFQTLVGYPLETLKTRWQVYDPTRSSLASLYKGWPGPFLGQCVIHPLFFGTYTWLHDQHQWSPGMAGATVGGITALVMNPIEVRKTCIQAKVQVPPWSCLWRRGIQFTMGREIIGSAVYWHTFESLVREDDSLKSSPSTSWLPWQAGASAGILSWIVSYPMDVWKTQSQTNHHSLYSKQRLSRIITAWSITMFRAAVVNGGVLYIYHECRRPTSSSQK